MLETSACTTGPLNQYTAIGRGEEAAFEPVYDADGNQTLIRTSTGIWQVTYNAENRPVRFVNESAKTVVECTYDYMGRQHTRKVSVNGTVSSYLRYMYRGYLQIAAIDAVSGAFRWFLFQNLTQPEATRPLAIRKDGAWYAYGWDLTRNVTEIFGKAGYLRTVYTYTPYGEATAEGDVTQPIQWSSEYNDEELGLVYYNYRHLNPHDGRWISRDPIMEQGGWNLFAFVNNNGIVFSDKKGENYNPFTPGMMNPPSTYDSPVYTPSPKKVSISITYSAICQDVGIWDWLINISLADKITKTPSDFDPNSECNSCQCIKKLTVIMHGTPNEYVSGVSAQWGDTHLFEGDKFTEISDMFKNIKFCSSCELELRSCHLGEYPFLKQRLENNTKCKVTVYQGGVNAFFPRLK